MWLGVDCFNVRDTGIRDHRLGLREVSPDPATLPLSGALMEMPMVLPAWATRPTMLLRMRSLGFGNRSKSDRRQSRTTLCGRGLPSGNLA
jgi:hypothetical protein